MRWLHTLARRYNRAGRAFAQVAGRLIGFGIISLLVLSIWAVVIWVFTLVTRMMGW